MPNSSAGIIGRRPTRRRRDPRKNPDDNRPHPRTPVRIIGVTVNAAVITVEYNQAVTLQGSLPLYSTDVAGAVVTGAAQATATTIDVTFDQDVSLATVLNIQPNDPAVRNSGGGVVADTVFLI